MSHTLILIWSCLLAGLDPSILTLAWNAHGVSHEGVVSDRDHRVRGLGPISIPWIHLPNETTAIESSTHKRTLIENIMNVAAMNVRHETFLFQFSEPSSISGRPPKFHQPETQDLAAKVCIALENQTAVTAVSNLVAGTSRDLLSINRRWFHRGLFQSLARLHQESETWSDCLCAWQAECIIRKLNKLGNKATSHFEVDPYWAHYENYDRWNVVLSNPIPHKPRIQHKLPKQNWNEAMVQWGASLQTWVDYPADVWHAQLRIVGKLRSYAANFWQPWEGRLSPVTVRTEIAETLTESVSPFADTRTGENARKIHPFVEFESQYGPGCHFFASEN